MILSFANDSAFANDPASDTFPAWSPDGGRSAFDSDRGGGDGSSSAKWSYALRVLMQR